MKQSSSSNSSMKLALSSLPKASFSGEGGTLGSFPEPVWKALLAHLGTTSPGDLRSMASLNKELSCLVREVLSSTPRRSIIRASRPTSARIHKRPSAHRRTISSVISSQQKMPKTEINDSLRNVSRGSPPSPPPALADRSIIKPPRLKSEKKSKKKKKNQLNQPAASSPQPQIIPPEVTTVFLKHLHDELNKHVQTVRELVASKITPKAESMTRRIELLTKYLWHNAHVEVYGSMATGLALPTSDLDLCIVGATFGPNGENPFDMLVNELRKQPWLDTQSFQPISTARTPVIKLLSQIENLPTDITFCDTVHHKGNPNRRNTSFLPGFFHRGLESRDLIRMYVKRMPMLVPLVIVLKELLLPLGLNNSFQGGLSSFALVLMVVSFLQLHTRDTPADQPHVIPVVGKGKGKKGKGANNNNNNHSNGSAPSQQHQPKPPRGTRLGDMLFRLVRYYAFFDYHKIGIDVADGGREFEITQAHYDAYGCIPPMVLLDPTDPHANLTNNTFAMYRIKNTFLVAYEYLLAQSKEPQHSHSHHNHSHQSHTSSPPLLLNFFSAVQETAHSVSPRPLTPALAPLPSSSSNSSASSSSCVMVPQTSAPVSVSVSPPQNSPQLSQPTPTMLNCH